RRRLGRSREGVRGDRPGARDGAGVKAGTRSGSIRLNTPADVAQIRESAQIVGRCLERLGREVRPGISTSELDAIAEKFIRDSGGEPAFQGYKGYPASICASVNEEVVHGIPSVKRILREG